MRFRIKFVTQNNGHFAKETYHSLIEADDAREAAQQFLGGLDYYYSISGLEIIPVRPDGTPYEVNT